MPRIVEWGRLWRLWATILAALSACTLAAYGLENGLGLPDASAVYLLGVAAVAIRSGATPAIATAAGAFLVYNFLFIEPRYTLTVAKPEQLLNLILFLVIGALIGRLAGRQRDREQLASRREREAQGLYAISRALNTADGLEATVPSIVERLASDSRMERIWVVAAAGPGPERVLADSRPGAPRPEAGTYALLRRDDAEGAAAWRRIHPPQRRGSEEAEPARLYRIDLAVGGDTYGALWALRARGLPEPTIEEARLLASAADQVAQAVRRQRLAATAAEVELARREERAKTALLDSVSHDLRTPLATIRAAAGSLADPDLAVTDAERSELGTAIDREADRLNRLVSNLLDMSRIESGALAPDLELVPLGAIVEAVVERLAEPLAAYRLEVDTPDDLPPAWADPLLVDQVLTNLLENVTRYVPAGSRVVIRVETEAAAGVAPPASDRLVLSVEDGGPGITGSPERLFDKFHREPRAREGARHGTGLGLAVVRGLAEAMGGSVGAERSPLGGLAVRMTLRSGERRALPGTVATDEGAAPAAVER
jgi:two-component system sensor histidine kinase KdpD